MCALIHRQAVILHTLIAAHTLSDNTISDPYQRYMKCETGKKKLLEGVGQKKTASYRHTYLHVD